MSTQLVQIAKKAQLDRKVRFTSLTHLLTPEFLKETWKTINRHGASGVDGESIEQFESELEQRVKEICAQLRAGAYRAPPVRRVEIPKGPGKSGTRPLGIPTISDRLLQKAVARILGAIFEADFCDVSYGYRPARSPHQALHALREQIRLGWVNYVYEADIRGYFDTVRHSILLDKIAKRIQDPKVMHLVKQILKAAGKIGVPQGGPFSPLAANIYLTEIDWMFDTIRRETAQGPYEAVNYHRFADDLVITVSGHSTKRGWAERALQRLEEQLTRLGVTLNREKTKIVDTLKGEAFGFLGFDLRRVRKREKAGYYVYMTPKKKARKAIKVKIRDIIASGGALTAAEIVTRINTAVAGWVTYFRVGNSSRAFSEVRDYMEMKIRSLLSRRRRRRKCSIGWRRWSNEYLYGILGLYWDWTLQTLPGLGKLT